MTEDQLHAALREHAERIAASAPALEDMIQKRMKEWDRKIRNARILMVVAVVVWGILTTGLVIWAG